MKTIITAFILWAGILVFASFTAHGQQYGIISDDGYFNSPLILQDSTYIITILTSDEFYKNSESYSMTTESLSWVVCDSSDCSGFEIRSDQIMFYTPNFSLRIDLEGNFFFDEELILCEDEVASKMREFLLEISRDKYPKFNH